MKLLTLVFLKKDSQVLLAMKKRGFGVGKWNGVGGKVESGETIPKAMVRECQEEIGVTPIGYEEVATIIFKEHHEGELKQMKVHVFMCSNWIGEPVESEEMRPQWYPVDDLPFDDMWADDPYWLPQVLNGKSLTAEFTLNETNEVTDNTVNLIEPVLRP